MDLPALQLFRIGWSAFWSPSFQRCAFTTLRKAALAEVKLHDVMREGSVSTRHSTSQKELDSTSACALWPSPRCFFDGWM